MIEKDRVYVVMGLLNTESIAFAVGEFLRSLGGRVVYTVLNERMKRLFLDRSKDSTKENLDSLDLRYCDVTKPEEVQALFQSVTQDFGEPAGVVHSVAYANPKTLLGLDFHTEAFDDLKESYHISAVSLATVTRYAVKAMPHGGAVVTLSFDSERAYPYYNWMGVNKAALEAVVRALARRHGRDRVRVNAVSAGPVFTMAASKIPGFTELEHTWHDRSPIPWDPFNDKTYVAHAVAFLLGPFSQKITGQVLHVDGGVSAMGASLTPAEFGELQ